MAFMQKQVVSDTWATVENNYGESWVVPADLGNPDNPLSYADYIENGSPVSVEVSVGYCGRLSAPGYMDCTEWSGPFKTRAEAQAYLDEQYPDDESDDDEEF